MQLLQASIGQSAPEPVAKGAPTRSTAIMGKEPTAETRTNSSQDDGPEFDTVFSEGAVITADTTAVAERETFVTSEDEEFVSTPVVEAETPQQTVEIAASDDEIRASDAVAITRTDAVRTEERTVAAQGETKNGPIQIPASYQPAQNTSVQQTDETAARIDVPTKVTSAIAAQELAPAVMKAVPLGDPPETQPKRPTARHIMETVLAVPQNVPSAINDVAPDVQRVAPQIPLVEPKPVQTEPQTSRTPAPAALQPETSFATADSAKPEPDPEPLLHTNDKTTVVAKAATPPTTPPMAIALSQPAGNGIAITEDAATLMKGEAAEVVQLDIRGATTTVQSQSGPIIPARTEIPPHITQQIAAALHKGADRPIEIALNPPELGRVRMILSASEAGMVVHVLTERTDTLDLMRRNIDDLGRELGAMGYEDISFSFGQSDTNSEQREGETPRDGLYRHNSEDTPVTRQENARLTQTPLRTAPDSIDIRI